MSYSTSVSVLSLESGDVTEVEGQSKDLKVS